MKSLVKLTLLAAALATALPFLQADPVSAPAGEHPRPRALAQRGAVRQRLAKRLGLSADQVTQLKATRMKTIAAIKAVRADASLTAEQKKTKVRETWQTAHTEMRGLLTVDQRQKLDQLKRSLRSLRRLG